MATQPPFRFSLSISLFVPNANSTAAKNMFAYEGAVLYDGLPMVLKSADDFIDFKRTCNKAVRQRSDLLFIATSLWFEESPCAVQTNTVGLGRLCTLFVLSTLLVFEHMHAVLSSTLVLCRTMITTNTAAISNSRYADTDRVKNVFLIRFPKPHLDRAKPNECLQI